MKRNLYISTVLLLYLFFILQSCVILDNHEEISISTITKKNRVEIKLKEFGSIELNTINASPEMLKRYIEIKGEKHAEDNEALNDISLITEEKTDSLFITATSSYAKAYAIDLKVTVPSFMIVELTTKDGNIIVTNLNNDLIVSTEKGDVLISDIVGDVDLKVGVGNAKLKNVIGNISAKVNDGNVVFDSRTKQKSNTSINVKNGNIDFYLRKELSAVIIAKTDDGGVRTEEQFSISNRSNNHLNGTINKGTSNIKLNIEEGNINILKKKENNKTRKRKR